MRYSSTRQSLFPPLWVTSLAAMALALWLLYALKEIVFLLVAGYGISYVIDPCLSWLETKKVRRPIGVFVLLLISILALLLMTVTVVPTILREYSELAKNLPSYVATVKEKIFPAFESIRSYLPAKFQTIHTVEDLKAALPGVSGDAVQKIMAGVGNALLKGYSITLTLVNLALLPFIVYYLAIDFKGLHQRMLSLVPHIEREKVKDLFLEIDSFVSAFFRGQFVVGAILFVLYAIGLGFVGVELWFLLAVVSGFGNIIPYLGALVGIVLSTVMALVTFGDFIHVAQVWAVFVVVQFLEGTFVTPKVLGDRVGLSPLAVILAIMAGGTLFGLVGVFLAVPGAAVARVLARRLHTWVLQRL